MLETECLLKIIENSVENLESVWKCFLDNYKGSPRDLITQLSNDSHFQSEDWKYKNNKFLVNKGKKVPDARNEIRHCGIYIVSAKKDFIDSHRTEIEMIYKKASKTPNPNEEVKTLIEFDPDRYVIYIGKSLSSLESRIRTHIIGEADASTSSLKLEKVMKDKLKEEKSVDSEELDDFMNSIEFNLLYFNREDASSNRAVAEYYANSLERLMHKKYKPLLGSPRS